MGLSVYVVSFLYIPPVSRLYQKPPTEKNQTNAILCSNYLYSLTKNKQTLKRFAKWKIKSINNFAINS